MADDTPPGALSPTVLKVIQATVATLRTNEKIPVKTIDLLENLLKKGTVPKPDAIITALFDPPMPK